MIVQSPSSTDILAGVDTDDLADLSPRQRQVLAIIMARAAERSYRRGFQQGVSISERRPDCLPSDLHEWRYTASADASPWADAAKVETSLERLHTENSGLRRIFPTSVTRPVTIDIDEAAQRLIQLAAAQREAQIADNGNRRGEVVQLIQALAHELATAGGGAMSEVYDRAQEIGDGAEATQGVSPLWDNIASWAD